MICYEKIEIDELLPSFEFTCDFCDKPQYHHKFHFFSSFEEDVDLIVCDSCYRKLLGEPDYD